MISRSQGNLSPAVAAKQTFPSPSGAKRNWSSASDSAPPVPPAICCWTALKNAWTWALGDRLAAAIASRETGQRKLGVTLACNICCPDREGGDWIIATRRSPYNARFIILRAATFEPHKLCVCSYLPATCYLVEGPFPKRRERRAIAAFATSAEFGDAASFCNSCPASGAGMSARDQIPILLRVASFDSAQASA